MNNYYQKVWLGSQYYINSDDTPNQIHDGLAAMERAGLKLVRIFLQWHDIERQPNVWDWSQYDALFEAAENYNLKVVVTLMAVHPPGWMQLTGGSQEVGPLTDSTFWRQAENYVTLSVQRYHQHPALHSWILWNEPSWKIPHNDLTLKLYQNHLAQIYQRDLTSYNRRVYQQITDFNQIQFPKEDVLFGGYAERLDWRRFSVALLNDYLKQIKGWIRLYDPEHPVHTNPHNLATEMSGGGQSIWEQATFTDFLGCSAHPSWHSVRFAPQRRAHSVAFFADLTRSASSAHNHYFWVSELQGGTNIYSGLDYLCPSPQELQLWLWESIGAGAAAVLFWCFNARLRGFEAGEWSLVNQLGMPSKRLQAVSQVANILERHADLFSAAQRPPSRLAILYSEATCRLGVLEGQGHGNAPTDPRNAYMGMDAVVGAYLLCSDLGLAVDFIDEKRLQTTEVLNYECLILPGCTALEDLTLATVQSFVKKGGTLIADGLCGYKTPDGIVRDVLASQLTEIFGAKVADIEALNDMQSQFALYTDNMRAFPLWFLKVELETHATTQVLACFGNSDETAGSAALTYYQCEGENTFGRAVRIGTVFFQRYFRTPSEEARNLLQKWLPRERSETKIWLENPSTCLRFRNLKVTDKVELIILANTDTQPHIARLRLVADANLLELVESGYAKVDQGKSAEPEQRNQGELRMYQYLRLAAGSVRVFRSVTPV